MGEGAEEDGLGGFAQEAGFDVVGDTDYFVS